MILYSGAYTDNVKKLCISEGEYEMATYTKVDLTNLSRQQVIELFMFLEEGALPFMIPYPTSPSDENEFFNLGDYVINNIENDIEGVYILKMLDGMPMEMRAKGTLKKAKEDKPKEIKEVKAL